MSVAQPVVRSGPYTAAEDEFLSSRWMELSHAELAAELDRTVKSVRSRCWRLRLVEPNDWSEREIEVLKAAYKDAAAGESIGLDSLAQSLGRHKTNICRKARELGLTDQSRKKVLVTKERVRKYATDEELRAAISERSKRYIAENGHPRGALGMKHSQATKDAISRANHDWWASLSEDQKSDHILKAIKGKRDAGIPFAKGARGSWKAAWREIGGQRCFFRSRWEANYARYLEWLRARGDIASWEHEAQTFWFEGIKRGVVSYLPDFKVVTPGGAVEWHEVKGWMDARSKTTIARMGRYHPKEKLVVIQQKQYDEIRRKLSTMIPDWEA